MSADTESQKFVEKRAVQCDPLMALVQQVHDNQMAMQSRMDAVPSELATAIASLMDRAFPEGDPDGHRSHHEAVIKAAEERAEFWKKMRYELAKWGLIGFVAWSVAHLWSAFLQGPAK